MNLKIRLFKQAIVNFIEGSDLPIEVQRLILGEIYSEVEKQSNATIGIELANESEGGDKDAESIQQNQLGELPE